MNFTGTDTNLSLNWRHVWAFLGLTFGLTWRSICATPSGMEKGGSLALTTQAVTLEAGSQISTPGS